MRAKRSGSRKAAQDLDSGRSRGQGDVSRARRAPTGRKTRTVPVAIKRALVARDKSCAFPGCHHKRFVDAHHIQHWSAGGETSLDNLMLLCSQHHKLVHEGGFAIERDYRNHWFFRPPDGRAVPVCGYDTQDTLDDDVADLSELFKNFVSEPPAPAYWH